MRYLLPFLPACLLLICACSQDVDKGQVAARGQEPDKVAPAKPFVDYNLLRHKITYGQATLADVRKALTATDAKTLTNIVHALYSMRWLRGVHYLLLDMWDLKKDKYPELSWALLQRAPVRLALASTINRARIIDTDAYLDYIRAYKFDDDPFNRAQVVVALGFNGDPQDIEYIKSMAAGDNHYVVQSAVTGLALMGGNQARDAMIALWRKYRDTPRGDLLIDLLDKSYHWRPEAKAKNAAGEGRGKSDKQGMDG